MDWVSAKGRATRILSLLYLFGAGLSRRGFTAALEVWQSNARELIGGSKPVENRPKQNLWKKNLSREQLVYISTKNSIKKCISTVVEILQIQALNI